MEQLKHECGIAMVRLRKPLDFYQEKYGTWMYGLNKLYLLMEKQHNRGQEGAGVACVKLDAHPGEEFMFRERAEGTSAISKIFQDMHKQIKESAQGNIKDATYASQFVPFAGELYMGHLRYSTTGKSGLSYVHPFMRRDNYRAKNLAICGNFNLTNVDEIFNFISRKGQHPRKYADAFILLEQIGHRLDREVERVYDLAKEEGKSGTDITYAIEEDIKLENVLKSSAWLWDGGYVMCGVTGSGESFMLRDPWGIRPAFYYADDEIVITASERPVIQTALNLTAEQVIELNPGEAMLIDKAGKLRLIQVVEPKEKQACSFERIYFSRGSDVDIYNERKALGENVVPAILKSVDNDLKNTVFSFIPNTAEVAFYGMIQCLNQKLNDVKNQRIRKYGHRISSDMLDEILAMSIRSEKVAIKDIKLRTFISEGNSRNELAAHVYDITYGSLIPHQDNLVVIDDSIVRGTTLKQSIIKILARLQPKKIVIVSSSPQIRYPDFYGIDMSNIDDFIAFRAAIALLQEDNKQSVIDNVYKQCAQQKNQPQEVIENYVKQIYEPFTPEQISAKSVELLTPREVTCPVELVYQSLEGLLKSCPNHTGNWYFSGDYPTQGGKKLVNEAFIRYYEKKFSKQ
ncbi:MAG: amidophosphoribosyltransferase [Paludibacteraceae bacterium]|nr:amidophosphoribosyltransferase [Paludibacteraceae bacterium]MBP6284448.1 amidophosphoribosyltransferase [Paludibacteraceae bacterium]